jgi:hypothetical protein
MKPALQLSTGGPKIPCVLLAINALSTPDFYRSSDALALLISSPFVARPIRVQSALRDQKICLLHN